MENKKIEQAPIKEAQNAPQKTESENKKELLEVLINEINELKKSLLQLKQNNEMLNELVCVNFEKEETQPSEALLEKLKKENEMYKKLAVRRIKDMIFNKVKEEYPDITYNAFEEFPEEFHRLVCAHVSPATAYRVITDKKIDKKPENMGKVNSDGDREKDFYTSQEVDKLTKKQLSNPKVMETVLKSMLKW